MYIYIHTYIYIIDQYFDFDAFAGISAAFLKSLFARWISLMTGAWTWRKMWLRQLSSSWGYPFIAGWFLVGKIPLKHITKWMIGWGIPHDLGNLHKWLSTVLCLFYQQLETHGGLWNRDWFNIVCGIFSHHHWQYLLEMTYLDQGWCSIWTFINACRINYDGNKRNPLGILL